MASSNISSHTRSRSLRVPPSNTLKAPPSGMLRPLSAAPSPGPSNVTLFLTNLRLLDLDRRQDWPGITGLTFTTRDAQQNQKKRIQRVEWALYQLFVLWDPEEARNRLQPFFPPLEPLQSLNLRSALFRCLDQAKKNGVLGRDTVLRKTMLDECKGEKLEEILAVFSNVVLKKVVQEAESDNHDSLAQKLALENLSYNGDRTTLLGLILAHKSALSKHLRDKEASRAKYQDFSDLLHLNERRLARRREELKETIEQHGSQNRISGREARGLQDQVQQNWSGNPEWLESILYGDSSKAGAEGLLATRFDKVWSHVENGTIGDVEDKHHVGLLEQLENRVRDQEDRLARWQDFGKTLAKNGPTSPSKYASPAKAGPKKIDLGFNQHQNLQIGQISASKSPHQNEASLEEYSRLIDNMKAELADVGKRQVPSKRGPRQSLLSTARRSSVMPQPESPVASKDQSITELNEEWSSASDDSEEDSEDDSPDGGTPAKPPSPKPPLKDSGVFVQPREISPEHTLVEPPSSSMRTTRQSPIKEILSPEPRHSLRRKSAILPPIPTPSPALTPSPIPPTRTPSPIEKPQPKVETESDLADRILNSLSEASPSPRKLRHTLSLAERTRLSMSRTTHSKYSDLHDAHDLDDLPIPRLSLKSRPSLAPAPPPEPEIGLHANLIERTRKSMAGFEAAQKKAQLERRRSVKDQEKKQRKSSYFPKVEEKDETPDISAIELLEQEGDIDYESVFKSRPKIKTSPAVSPSRIWEEEETEDE